MITVKLQNLRQEFETMNMKQNELVQDYISRMVAIINKMWPFGDDISDQKVVEKVL